MYSDNGRISAFDSSCSITCAVHPVTRDATVVCQAPEEKPWKRFLATYRRYGRARLALQTQVMNSGSEDVAVQFEGQYVLHR